MTLNTNAKVAGFVSLAYLAAGLSSMAVAANSAALLAVVQSFCALLLRGRMIPAGLVWLGVIASAGIVLLLSVQIAGFLGGPRNWASPLTWAAWSPTLVFELALAAWLITKGIVRPAARAATQRAEHPAL